jgi:hypothetical protein
MYSFFPNSRQDLTYSISSNIDDETTKGEGKEIELECDRSQSAMRS